MPVTRDKRHKKRVVKKTPFIFESTVVPTPEVIAQKPQQKLKGNFDEKKPLNKKVVSNKNLHLNRTANK